MIDKVPTDSLYKFVFLSGIVSLLFITGWYFNQIDKITTDIININVENQTNKAEMEYLNRDIALIDSVDPNLERSLILSKRYYELEKKVYKVDGGLDEISKKDQWLSRIKKSFWFIISLHLIWIGCGVYFWYNRLQKYNDEIIKIELEMIELELRDKKKES